ncbi:hypothetical protein BGZ79_006138 [Entomortierella chlamydospora]|nr:hypothetical protein BGZ79_006138 [Entomortierella chlamydospora]
MQLQAERDHFVHSGIGGGSSSSSSSPSCSPPKDSLLSLVKVAGLKKPRPKGRDKDKEKDKDQAKLKTVSTDKSLRKMKSTINVSMEVDVDMTLNKKDMNMDMDISIDKVIDFTEEKCLPTTSGNIVCVSDTEMSTEIGTTKDSSASHQPAPSQSQTQSSRLNALELSRVAQVSKFCARMANDNAVWRVKSIQHPLFSERHIQGQRGAIPWLAYYKFLHQKSLVVKQNWADARPQAVHILEGHTGLVTSLEMSMWTLVTASIDSTLRVWDLRTLQCLQVLHSKHSLNCVAQCESANAACARTSFGVKNETLTCVSFSRSISGLCIWDTRTGELILQDDAAMPQNASFIYIDECYIGYGQSDGAVTVFDWSSRTSLKIVGSYQAHNGDNILEAKLIPRD